MESKSDVESIFKIIMEEHKRSLNSVQDELQTLKLQQAVACVEESSLKKELSNIKLEVVNLRLEVVNLRATETQLINEIKNLNNTIRSKDEIIEAKEETIRFLKSKSQRRNARHFLRETRNSMGDPRSRKTSNEFKQITRRMAKISLKYTRENTQEKMEN
jgi:chromosome segregation ATPase